MVYPALYDNQMAESHADRKAAVARRIAVLGSTVAVLAFTCGFAGTKVRRRYSLLKVNIWFSVSHLTFLFMFAFYLTST
jgi:hypothetical protein